MVMDMMQEEKKIIVLPELEKLQKEIAQLRTELSMLILERDELQHVICKNVEMEYILAVGVLECKVFELDCQLQRIKRKISLVQTYINHQKKVELEKIEQQLDAEFAAYKKQLESEMNKINAAISRSQGRVLREEEQKELKQLYRTIVKALHPDLHHDLTEAQINLYYNAVDAYKHGDLPALRAIAILVDKPEESNQSEDTLAKLTKEKERLEQSLQAVNATIDEIKKQYPYTLKSLLDDPDKLSSRKQELQFMIEQYQDTIAQYNTRLQEMLS